MRYEKPNGVIETVSQNVNPNFNLLDDKLFSYTAGDYAEAALKLSKKTRSENPKLNLLTRSQFLRKNSSKK